MPFPRLEAAIPVTEITFQHLEMAMPVTELTAQQLGYFERESAHTLEFRFIHPLKDDRRRAIEKKLV